MIEIRDVWADNLLEEMENIRQIVDDYPFVSMVRDGLMHPKYYYIFDLANDSIKLPHIEISIITLIISQIISFLINFLLV